MYFEEALIVLRQGNKITRVNNKYGWDYIEIYEGRLLATYAYRGIISRKELKIFGKAFLDNKWIEYKEIQND